MSEQQDKAARAQHALRVALSDGYAAVAGRQYTRTVSALTLGDIAQRQIDAIKVDGGPTRPSKLNEVARVKQEVASAVASAKLQDPTLFEGA